MRRHPKQTPQGSPHSRARTVSFTIVVAIGGVFAWIKPPALVTASPSAVDVLTYHNDNARTGQNLNEGILTPANVRMATFGKVAFFAVDGKVDAQPLLLSGVTIPGRGIHDVLYVATEHDTIYGLDAITGAVLWSRSLLGTGESPSEAVFGCGQVAPEIGITSTPVINRSAGPNGVIYVVAMSKIGSTYIHRLHALDVTSGAELFGGPQTVAASGFVSKQYEERSALLLLNGMIITSWTSHCDADPYHGWIMSYNASTLAQTSALNTTPNGSRGAYWMAGAGPAADSAGNIYLLAGNGTFDTTLDGSGFPSQGDFGNAFLKVSNSPALAVVDYFATFDTVSKSDADSDLGSGGTLVLPDLLDITHQVRHLAVGAGKDGHIYLADRDSMGRFHATPSDNSNLYQDVSGALSGGVWSMPAYFNSTLYYGAQGNVLKAFSIISAKIVPTPTSQSTQSFAYPGTTPGVSASGGANAIVWAVESAASSPAVLHAYDALNLSNEFYNSNQAPASRDAFGPGNKFITPTIVNGRVYVGTPNGVAVFGLLGEPPTVTTGAAGPIHATRAFIQATVNPNGAQTTMTVEYGRTTTYGSTSLPLGVAADTIAVAIGQLINGLLCNTLYHYRAVATNATASAFGADVTFTSAACGFSTRALPGDFDGDGKAELAVYRPSNGSWYALQSSTNSATYLAQQWGEPTDIPVPGDYDGDGKTDFAVYRPSTGFWYVLQSSTSNATYLAQQWGVPTDIPVPDDYDGDGKTDFAVYRPSTGFWYVLQSSTSNATYLAQQWGVPTDIPVPGDYDGDGKTDFAVYRPSTGFWYVLQSSTSNATYLAQQWGEPTDIPAPGDYDGDGKTDLAVYRPSTGFWYVLQSSTSNATYLAQQWGVPTDIPLPGDYDGDSKTDLAVYRPSTGFWDVLQSSTNYATYLAQQWGSAGDIPLRP